MSPNQFMLVRKSAESPDYLYYIDSNSVACLILFMLVVSREFHIFNHSSLLD